MTEPELCERFLPLLQAFGRRHLRDRVAAEELAQETLTIVLGALREGRISSTERLGAYVLGVARNLIRESYRRDKRNRELTASLASLDHAASVPVELDHRLRFCISRLTARARTVLQRAIIQEESAIEIAGALGLSPVNVRVIRHRALAEVRKCLQNGGS